MGYNRFLHEMLLHPTACGGGLKSVLFTETRVELTGGFLLIVRFLDPNTEENRFQTPNQSHVTSDHDKNIFTFAQ